ncbi:amidase [Paucibacter sp. JuS9]|uniref:amidase n=1 Tax=Paucibacter sp. JuS9 TaxID=3228748 RepID=UPI003757A93C
MNRRSFATAAGAVIGASLGSSNAAAASAPGYKALDKLDVAGLQAAMTAGKLSAMELTRHCLKRIDGLNQRGPKLRAVIELNPDALAQARAMDAERRDKKAPRVRGPLHGIPVLLKDNIATADRMSTTAGSLALAGLHAQRDAHIVERLRAAGAVILGKTNLSEWANIRSNRSSSGWSSRGGQTRNPHVLNRSPSGSSSGSAVAAAAHLAPLTVGTETDGSICSPAQACGVVGFKPTVGLVSRSGIIPISASQDTAGPIVRHVRDAALLLQAMAGTDPTDPVTLTQAATLPDFTAGLQRESLQGKRIGVIRAAVPNQPAVAALFEKALATLREQGAVLIDPMVIPNYAEVRRGEFTVLIHELKDGVAKYLAAYQSDAPVKTLADVIAWNKAHAEQAMPFFAQETLEAAEATQGIEAPAYLEALANCRRLSRAEGIDAMFAEHKLDAIVGPTGNIAWPIDHLLGDRFTGGGFGSMFAIAGYPHLTVPMGMVGGLPVGISFAAQAWQDARVLALGHAFEQASPHLQAPRYLQETGLN